MLKDQISRALDVCLQSLQSGMELEHVLNMFPQWRAELSPLIKSAFFVQQMGEAIQVPDAVVSENREAFLLAVQDTIPAARKTRRQLPFRAFLWGVLLTAGLMLCLLGASLLFGRALPGSIFYPVKESVRQARLLITQSSFERIRLRLAYDQARVAEIGRLKQKAKEVRVSFGGSYTQSPEGNWLVAGLPVSLQAETQWVGNIWSGVYVQVQGVLQKDGAIVVERIQAQQFLVDGVVESMTPERLVLNGTPVMLSPDTLILGNLLPGVRVEAMLLLSSEDLFSARWIKVISSLQPD